MRWDSTSWDRLAFLAPMGVGPPRVRLLLKPWPNTPHVSNRPSRHLQTHASSQQITSTEAQPWGSQSVPCTQTSTDIPRGRQYSASVNDSTSTEDAPLSKLDKDRETHSTLVRKRTMSLSV